MSQTKTFKILVTILMLTTSLFFSSVAQAATPDITFPIRRSDADQIRWTDTWGAPRSGGRTHKGVDIMGEKMIPILAVESGVVSWSKFNNRSGNYLRVIGDSGWAYMYVHLNNDTPGTDNGSARCNQAFSTKLCNNLEGDRIKRGVRVNKGEVIGYMGDSGNAEWTAPHLHFEMHYPTSNGSVTPINPYPIVNRAFSKVEENKIDAVVSDTTSAEAQVLRLYRAYFGRIPGQEGFDYWVEKRNEGLSLEDVAANFTQSSEFYIRYSELSDSEYIDQLYIKVLNRLPDRKGKQYWLNQFKNKKITRSSIVVYFSEGPEMQARLRTYTEGMIANLMYKDKLMTTSEIRNWMKQRKTKTLDGLSKLILN